MNRLFINEFIKEGMVVLDATLGKGSDALILLEKIGSSGRLYGFDVQQEAIDYSETRLSSQGFKNYELLCDSHEHIKNHIKEAIDFAVFNLGYLPSYNKDITTTARSTVSAMESAFKLLKVGGLLMVTVYPGHQNGLEEARLLAQRIPEVDQKVADILHYQFINQVNHPPFTYLIEKKKEGKLWNEHTTDKR